MLFILYLLIPALSGGSGQWYKEKGFDNESSAEDQQTFPPFQKSITLNVEFK